MRMGRLTALDQMEYKDMISKGRAPETQQLHINLFNLNDLIKVAMDSDSKVIHDTKLGKFFVNTEDSTYVFDPNYVNHIMKGKQRIGKILLDRGVISQKEIETGLYYQKRVGSRLGDSLIALGFIDETTLYSTLAAQQNIPYYELDEKMEFEDTSWVSSLSINKARGLQVLPLGKRADGRYVVACGESAWAGIRYALEDIFGLDLYIVAARPSRIFDILDKLEQKIQADKIKNSYGELLKDRSLEPYERITGEELELFEKTYRKGKLDNYLFIKAMGLTSPSLLAQVPDKESTISWLSSRSQIDGEVANLILAMNKIIKRMANKERQDKQLPDLLGLLEEACYITPDTADWVSYEMREQSRDLRELLVCNYLVSSRTLEHAGDTLRTLKKLINRVVIY